MNFRKRLRAALLCAPLFVLTLAQICCAQRLTLVPFKASGIYAIGEKVGWTASLPKGTSETGDYKYTIKKNNFDVIKTGNLNFSSGSATIEVSLDEPAMVYVQVSSPGGGVGGVGGTIVGAAVAPEKLELSVSRPADFDEFWKSKIEMLEQIPANAVVTPGDSGRPDIEYDLIKMDHINGTHVYGQLAKPRRQGKFPGLVIFQWASPPYPLQKQWVIDRAAEGWLALNIEPHDVLPTEPHAYYSALPQALKNYQSIGNDDRDKCYFLQMYLADYRAVDYLASRPDWNGRILVARGTSMGGQQSLCVAALNPKVTDVIVDEPSGCDSTGPLHGRASGYPNWPSNNPKIMETSRYFDAVNFASRIRVPSLVAMGFVDTTAPPVGIWTAFNQIPGPKEAVPMIDSPHNHLATDAQQRPYTDRSAQWLRTLVQGGSIMPGEESDQPIPRMDHNSQIAHAELVEKARQGRIEVYFEGDSITRRWGTSDDQYKDFLANWNQNFHGWNAADFGWGGDTTQNILWRLQNGELDNVNPKIIVLMAGTNNVGSLAHHGDHDAAAADITRGIKAILDLCREKAPGATIILVGITPRNDNMALMPVIERINANISVFADGKQIRFININDKLADSTGRLFEGMVGRDGLHLALKGYQIWADALKPIFMELLGPPGDTDLAPAPSGDPSARSKPAANTLPR